MSRLRWIVLAVFSGLVAGASVPADEPATITTRVLAKGDLPDDTRLGDLKTLDGHFPFVVPDNPAEWYARAESLRRRILVANGLWPMPDKTPLNAVIFAKTEREGFTVEKVSFESLPGHFVTGLLFRPTKPTIEKIPGVLCPHGHGGRNQKFTDEELEGQLRQGGEHFAKSGRTPKLARCAQLARMGCVSFIYDMLGYEDSVQIPNGVAHRHAESRPEEAIRGDEWPFFSIDADLRLQSIMGLQTWNAIRSLDFLASLPDVDPDRLAVTGGSGGGTQSIMLGAIDERIKASFPNGMVSTSMQGGCYCENCNLLRIGTGNVELAALMAPRPMAMTAADDWTVDMMNDGYPELKWLYAMIGNEADVYCRPMLQYKHNYNYIARATMYQWFNRHLKLGLDDPVIEQDFEPLTDSEVKIWSDQHPAPTRVGISHERDVCRWMNEQAKTKLSLDHPLDKESIISFREIVGNAWLTLMDAVVPETTEYQLGKEATANGLRWTTGLLRDPARGAELPLVTVANADVKKLNKKTVVWTSPGGKSAAIKDLETIRPWLDAGFTVMMPDLLGQGEFSSDGVDVDQQRVIDDPRSYSAFTFGYNPTLVASRCADLLTVISHAKQENTEVTLLAMAGSAAWAAPAAAIGGEALNDVVIDTAGFRFSQVNHYRDPNFVPGAVKYGDVPAILALRAPHRMTIVGETKIPTIVRDAFSASGASDQLRSATSITETATR